MIKLFGYDFSISELVSYSLSLFLTVFYAIKTGGIKKLIKEVNEIMIKFRSQVSVEPTVGQTISDSKPEYRYNKALGVLEKTGQSINLQEIVDSCADMVLSKVLERFLPAFDNSNDLIADYSQLRDDLDDLSLVMSKAEEYREYFGLSDDMSVQDIYKFVQSKASEVKSQIDKNLSAAKEPVVKEKEVISDEKNESKQA